ncbi:response regulator transcription factor [Anaerocolumna sp. MB42-C2]|uniref:response regulator transcription factor n=1 Tax=Anaerocolumna sp. MB42-C2 TaxID=3070997 RepID=UPI0027E1355C|nr:response regulator [Anaerocolumna sp. MB42-C2]WMJ89781.1 response regulator [Anaerocolumna sp. MB42-C2]
MRKIPVLFVDDEMIVRVALNSIVNWNETEFEIADTVSNGTEAMKFIRNNKVSLIVTDLKMPDMDGIELVKNLQEMEFPGKVIILTSYGEFEYARQAIQYGVSEYLLKSTFTADSLLEAMRKATKGMEVTERPEKKYEEEEMDTFDLDSIQSFMNHLKEELFGMSEIFEQEYYAYYILKKGRHTIKNLSNDKENTGTPEMFAGIIKEAIPKSNQVVIAALNNSEAIIIVKAKDNDILESSFPKLRNAANTYMNCKLVIVKSSIFSTRDQMQMCLQIIQKASGLVLYKAYRDIIFQEDYKQYVNEMPKNKYYEIIRICDCVFMSRKEEAINKVQNLIGSFQQNKYKVKETTQLIEKMWDCFLISWSFYFEETKDMEKIIKKYGNMETLEELEQVLIKWLEDIFNSTIKISSTDYRSEVKEIVDYIHVHLNDKIVIGDLTRVANFTKNYIGRLFKNEVGVNLMTYINMLKMEQALHILVDKNIMVKEVAGNLGYEDQSYFNRIFNRYFGKNPSEIKMYYANLYK